MSFEGGLDYESEHKKDVLRFKTREYLLLGAGPSNVSDRVLRAFSQQSLLPYGEDIFKVMDEVKSMMQYFFQTKNKLTLAGQSSGNGGNETIIYNLLDPGDKIVIAVGGFWGDIVLDMSQRYNLDALALRKPPGEVFTLEELEEAVRKHKADLLFVTHGESTGGTLQRLEGLGAMCHKYNCLLAADAVVSAGVVPLFVDRWEVDAVNSSTQKAVAAPAGLCLLTFSERAEKRMMAKKTRPPYYFDLKRIGLHWNCFEGPRIYHYTLSSQMVSALREGLAQICEEGLEAVWQRHEKSTKLFYKRLEKIGYECFVKKPENRFIGVTCVNVPEGVDQMDLLHFLREKYQIDIIAGAGPTLNKAIRIGLLGQNSRPEVVEYLSEALKDALNHFRNLS